jgi:hypothetical protein
MKLRKRYITFRAFFNKNTEDTTNNRSLTPLEEDRYKLDFTVDKKHYSIIIRKSTEYNNIEGIYTDDYNDCVTSEVKPFFAFNQDIVRPNDINKIYNRDDTCLIKTHKNREDRTFITDEHVYDECCIDSSVFEKNTIILDEIHSNLLSEPEEPTDKDKNI